MPFINFLMRKILFRTETATQRFIQSQCLTTSVCSYTRVVQNPDTPPPQKKIEVTTSRFEEIFL